MHPERAVVMYRPGHLPWERQIVVCMQYAHRHDYQLDSLAYQPDDALAVVQMQLAEVVVAVVHHEDDDELRDKIDAAGGRLEYCRRRRGRPAKSIGADTEDLVIAAYRRQAEPDQIATVFGIPVGRVRGILARFEQRLRPD
jgi:DNA-directed RNA polymerase specialized sigma24 family protein